MTRPTVVVGHSRKDKTETEALLAPLRVLERRRDIDLWCVDWVPPGADLVQEIRHAMKQADIAILLLTNNFLVSDLVNDHQIPILRERPNKEVVIFPVIARHCTWERDDWLTQKAVRPTHKNPIWREGGVHVERELNEIAKEVARLVDADFVGEDLRQLEKVVPKDDPVARKAFHRALESLDDFHEVIRERKQLHNILQKLNREIDQFKKQVGRLRVKYHRNPRLPFDRVYEEIIEPYWDNCKKEISKLREFAQKIQYIDPQPYIEEEGKPKRGPDWVIFIVARQKELDQILGEDECHVDQIYDRADELSQKCNTQLDKADTDLLNTTSSSSGLKDILNSL